MRRAETTKGPKGRILVVLVCLAMGGVGCASTGETRIERPLDIPLSSDYSVIEVEVSQQAGDDGFRAQLEGSVIRRLRDSGAFESVRSAEGVYPSQAGFQAGRSLNLRVEIQKFREVGEAARVWLGALAGRGKMEANVRLVDSTSGETLGHAVSGGKTSAGFAWAGTSLQAVERVAEEIAGYVLDQVATREAER